MSKKHKPVIQADCAICKHRVIDQRWNCHKCDLMSDNAGIKFRYDDMGKHYIFCHSFERRGK